MRIDPSSARYQSVRSAKTQVSDMYLAEAHRRPVRAENDLSPEPLRNVVGVGVGLAEVKGELTDELAVKVYVERKYSRDELTQETLLPSMVSGERIDVVEAGRFVRHTDPKQRLRPIQPGCSVGYAVPGSSIRMAGTLGAIVTDGTKRYVLSNNHVLADENQLPAGSPIFQPGLLDGGNNPGDQVAMLTKFIPLNSTANIVDCAIAELSGAVEASNQILQIGEFHSPSEAEVNGTVQKFGRTTLYTTGTVSSIDTDVSIQYALGNYTFSGQITVAGTPAPFSGGGDSGSLVLDMNSNPVGLLFAGSNAYSIANHISDVLAALDVRFA